MSNDPAPVLRVFADTGALAEAAAERFAGLAEAAIAEQGRFCVALAGGSTPAGLYRRLAASPWRERLDWSRVEVFFGDERSVPPDHADSNYRMARETLLDHVPVPPGQIHRMIAETEERNARARDYADTLRDRLPTDDDTPRFDLVLLGVGDDGHTASLFPGTPILDVRERLVAPVFVDRLATWRMSLTFPVLDAARHILFLAAGEAKAPVLERVFGAADGAPLPVQRLRPRGQCEWFVDRAAAGRRAGG